MARSRIAGCQLNTRRRRPRRQRRAHPRRARARPRPPGAIVAVFPELAITGYPPEDLLLKPGFVADNRAALDKVAARTGRCAAVVGFVDAGRDLLQRRRRLRRRPACSGVYRKRLLPNYAVFDEQRYFAPGTDRRPALRRSAASQVGVSICEDAWSPDGPIADAGRRRRRAHRQHQRARRTTPDASPSASACSRRAPPTRRARSSTSTRSAARTSWSSTARRWCSTPTASSSPARPQFVEDVLVVDLDVRPVFRKRLLDPRGRVASSRRCPRSTVTEPAVEHDDRAAPAASTPLLDRSDEVYEALVLGTRDYVRKNGFTDVVLGLSGGIDSSLVAVDRRRRARRRARARRVDAVALLERRLASPTPRQLADEPRHRLPHDRHRARPRRLPRHAGPSFAGTEPDLDRGEPAEPRSAACCSWRCRTSSAGSC